jgi:hypothetical protein
MITGNGQDKEAGLLGLWPWWLASSRHYWFVEPEFDYPDDFLLDPPPEPVCDPASFEFNDAGISEDGLELVLGMIKLQTYLIFDFICKQAKSIRLINPIIRTMPLSSTISAGALS